HRFRAAVRLAAPLGQWRVAPGGRWFAHCCCPPAKWALLCSGLPRSRRTFIAHVRRIIANCGTRWFTGVMTVMTKTGNEDRLTNDKLMVCLDVDGTIVNHQDQMSQHVRSAAREVVDAGHEVVISTGRSLGA